MGASASLSAAVAASLAATTSSASTSSVSAPLASFPHHPLAHPIESEHLPESGDSGIVTSCAIHGSRSIVVSFSQGLGSYGASVQTTQHSSVCLYDLATGRCFAKYPGYLEYVSHGCCLVVSPPWQVADDLQLPTWLLGTYLCEKVSFKSADMLARYEIKHSARPVLQRCSSKVWDDSLRSGIHTGKYVVSLISQPDPQPKVKDLNGTLLDVTPYRSAFYVVRDADTDMSACGASSSSSSSSSAYDTVMRGTCRTGVLSAYALEADAHALCVMSSNFFACSTVSAVVIFYIRDDVSVITLTHTDMQPTGLLHKEPWHTLEWHYLHPKYAGYNPIQYLPFMNHAIAYRASSRHLVQLTGHFSVDDAMPSFHFRSVSVHLVDAKNPGIFLAGCDLFLARDAADLDDVFVVDGVFVLRSGRDVFRLDVTTYAPAYPGAPCRVDATKFPIHYMKFPDNKRHYLAAGTLEQNIVLAGYI